MLLGIVFAAVALELGLRMIFPERVSRAKTSSTLAFVNNPIFGVGLKPGIEKVYTRSIENGGDRIPWRVNSQGYRGEELDSNPSWRVLVVGDSNIHARFSVLESTYCGKLEQKLVENQSLFRGKGEVVNAGIVGFGPDQSLLRLQHAYTSLKPDLVVFHLFADNDFGDLIRNRLFELSPDGESLSRTNLESIPDPMIEVAMADSEIETWGWRDLLFLRAARKIRDGFHARSKDDHVTECLNLCREEFKVYRNGAERHFSHFGDHYDLDLAIDPDGEAAQAKRQLMKLLLRAVRDYADDVGVALLVLVQPSSVDLSNNYLFGKGDLVEFEHYDPRRLTQTVVTLCRELGIEYVDLYPVFETDGESYFFRGMNNHWNERGQELAAEETVKAIVDREALNTSLRERH